MNKYIITFLSLIFMSCGKSFLEVKQNANTIIPQSVEDYQRILDNGEYFMNHNQSYRLSISSTDEIELTETIWSSIRPGPPYILEKNAYIWSSDPYMGYTGDDWNNAYTRILHANLVLDGLIKLGEVHQQSEEYRNVKGSALFFRALSYYQLTQLFCKPFNFENAKNDLGLPLRLEADVTIKSKRSNLENTFDRITKDLIDAAELLPPLGKIKLRPSQAAAYSILSRTYLHMGKYERALEYANAALNIQSNLIDFNDLNITTTYTFTADHGMANEEVIFMATIGATQILSRNRINVSSELLSLYKAGDIRKEAYFQNLPSGSYYFKGSYAGSILPFVGVSTSELLLIRSECYIRMGKTQEAITDLNELRRHRYKKDMFSPIQNSKTEEILSLILEERRKELAFRGLRWEDLRRFNQDPSLAITLSRKLGDQQFVLKPNSSRYVFPIPPDVIQLSGIPQN